MALEQAPTGKQAPQASKHRTALHCLSPITRGSAYPTSNRTFPHSYLRPFLPFLSNLLVAWGSVYAAFMPFTSLLHTKLLQLPTYSYTSVVRVPLLLQTGFNGLDPFKLLIYSRGSLRALRQADAAALPHLPFLPRGVSYCGEPLLLVQTSANPMATCRLCSGPRRRATANICIQPGERSRQAKQLLRLCCHELIATAHSTFLHTECAYIYAHIASAIPVFGFPSRTTGT
ncbi:hypothetical protein GGS20DRAFT_257712 [Poronia punctata]|nr:hypothetical protein GGS20DRAFT_257712 [Poronia punctata]